MERIRKYFRPNQPTISESETDIEYTEIQPDKTLENFVFCFWQLKTIKKLEQDFLYRVVSDGCVDIFFSHQSNESFIMGFCKKFVEFPIGKEFDYIGIRFLPSAFPFLFNINAKILSNQTLELKYILPNFAQWILKTITSKDSFETITKIFNLKLLQIIENKKLNFDNRFFDALSYILENNGNIDIETELKNGLSPRQMQRIFNYYIGTTPKIFSKVIRFQYILNAKPSKQSLKENKLYFEVGFFDQSHFIKDFKTFYGITPSEAFR